MNRDKFKIQMNRLVARFSGKFYCDDFLAILWREVSGFTDDWMVRTVDEFIGSERNPPLMAEFRKRMTDERERGWSYQKKVNESDAKEFTAHFQPEDIHAICESIRQKVKGYTGQGEFNSMNDSVSSLTQNINPYRCKTCFDSGVRDAFEGEPKGAIVCECRSRKPIGVIRTG